MMRLPFDFIMNEEHSLWFMNQQNKMDKIYQILNIKWINHNKYVKIFSNVKWWKKES